MHLARSVADGQPAPTIATRALKLKVMPN